MENVIDRRRFSPEQRQSYHYTHSPRNTCIESGNGIEKESKAKGRIIVVSNRLPGNFKKGRDGLLHAIPTYGGLVTALTPVVSGGDREALWVGWPGTSEKEGLEEALRTLAGDKMEIVAVDITPEEEDQYYNELCNKYLWPKLHGLTEYIDYKSQKHYPTYSRVQGKFADAIIANSKPGDIILANDYHQTGLAYELAQRGSTLPTGIFMHTPFSKADKFRYTDNNLGIEDKEVRTDILRKMTYYNLIRFQTLEHRNNFLECVSLDLPEAEIENNPEGTFIKITENGKTRRTKVDNFLISIDLKEFKNQANSEEVLEGTRKFVEQNPGTNIITVGRRDYTKGFPQTLEMLDIGCQHHPELIEQLTFWMIAPGSRDIIPHYKELTEIIDGKVDKINNKYRPKRNGRDIVQYNKKGLERIPLLMHYGGSRIGLYASIADGCALTPFEHIMSGPNDGSIILSTGAGAIERLGPVLPAEFKINPLHPQFAEQGAHAIYTAETMPKEKREAITKDSRAAMVPIDLWARDMTQAIEGSR